MRSTRTRVTSLHLAQIQKNKMGRKWFVYILKCKNGNFYTGITTDIRRRIIEHSNSVGAKSLRGKGPFELVHFEIFHSRNEASKREAQIKNLKRGNKINLINKKTVR